MSTTNGKTPLTHRWALTIGVLVVLVVAAAAVFARKPLMAELTDAPAGCPRILLLGARGSGETDVGHHGLGPEVDSLFEQLKAHLPADSQPKSLLTVFPAAPVQTLYLSEAEKARYAAALALSVPPAGLAVLYHKKHLGPFTASINEGIEAAVDELGVESGQCPHTRFVLAGYSQGAMVMHQALLRLSDAKRADLLDRIVATVLIADGDRKSETAATRYGNAPLAGEGIRSALTPAERDIPSAKASTTYDICAAGDLVCDFSLPQLAQVGIASEIHTGSYTGSPMIKAVARLIADGIIGVPAPTVPVPTATSAAPSAAGHDCVAFASDVTVPDGTIVPAGARFTKTWRLRNCGTTDWSSLAAVRVQGSFGPRSFTVPVTAPGASAEVSVSVTAPVTLGSARSTYRLRAADGDYAANQFWVQITVAAGTTPAAPTEALPPTSSTAGSTPPRTATPPPPIGGDSPPAADPGQPNLPAGARRLGPVDLDRYCADGWRMYAMSRYPVAWGWRCSPSRVPANGLRRGDQNVSVDDACAEQYSADARSHYRSYDDPNSWFCWVPAG